MQNFVEAQGHPVSDSVVYQDNQSAMLLKKNGRASSSKQTRHINIRYFFVTDQIASKEMHVEYCPTKEMLANFFTKPLQGTPFCKFQDEIMNIDPKATPTMDHRSVLELDAKDSDISDNSDGCVTEQGKRTRRRCPTTVIPRIAVLMTSQMARPEISQQINQQINQMSQMLILKLKSDLHTIKSPSPLRFNSCCLYSTRKPTTDCGFNTE